ncbi:pterin-4-alpha-carbinolamine dehydratase [Salipaludibacillus neizhouensis]|uniref:4a-hydroxytetrahydrobiopterin dehydratase n=1 Tax=Salipaludibacillus neizhouensis TaxID=885475 RepID=A0A3A9K6A6_9BACI|nr:4a-hydroxytetrahydrobiopterin dehydratase [Salipaludibacillus neizhouensis]RKL67779.1 pterin-4-alpha-carbinolamine dehydratase [Salipaludibacillus neizhouensis]
MILSSEDIQANLEDSKGWELEGDKWIKKHFTLSTFPKAIQFVNELANLAEDRQHHPYLIIDHKNVTIKLSTIDEGGLSQKDFESAHAYDVTFLKYD